MPVRASSFQEDAANGRGSPFTGAELVNTYNMVEVEGATGSRSSAVSSLPDGTVSKNKGVQLTEMKSALDRLMADVAGEAQLGADGKSIVGLKVEAVTEGVKAGQFGVPSSGDHRMSVDKDEEHDDKMDVDTASTVDSHVENPRETMNVSTLLHASFTSPTLGAPASSLTRGPSTIKQREELIKAKRREARRREREESDDGDAGDAMDTATGRPSRRRSKSTGDAEAMVPRKSAATRRHDNLSGGRLLDMLPIEDEEDPLADSIDRELERLKGPGKVVSGVLFGVCGGNADVCCQKYHVRERSETIYASADAESASRVDRAGGADNGKAWRAVKRPSDMVRATRSPAAASLIILIERVFETNQRTSGTGSF